MTLADAERLLNLIFRLFVGAAIMLLAVYAMNQWLGNPFETVGRLVDVNGVANIPSWFSSIQLFSIGIVFLCLRAVMGKCPGSGLFMTLGFGFIYLSLDEAVVIHEMITCPLRHVSWVPRFQGDHGIWITVYGLVGIWLLIAFKNSMLLASRNFPRPALIFISGAGLFLLGGVVLEVCNYYHLFETLYGLGPILEAGAKMIGGCFMLLGVGSALVDYCYQ
jgi:hypothetical protein